MQLDGEVGARLTDVAESCDAIAAYVRDTTFEHFAATRMMRAAVERELITIGEAIGAISGSTTASRLTSPTLAESSI
ncbi:MAG TPA: HepT-like ribonuclease domain-containing protein [Thermoanaerobaculia bacterium]|jgi:uncharacterized protein with HEPN domain